MLHLIDLRVLPTDPEQPFSVNMQSTEIGKRAYQIEVAGGFSVLRLRECASELFGAAVEELMLTYCGMLLGRDDAMLLEYRVAPGSFINILEERKPTQLQPRESRTVEVQLREITRVLPTIEQHFAG